MEGRGEFIRFWVRIFYSFSIVAILFTRCDGRKSLLVSKDISYPKNPNIKHLTILEVAKNLNMVMDISMKDSSNPEPYINSPFNMPPYDSLAPIPLPDNNNPPYCVYPPPQSPSTTMPSPSGSNPTSPSPTIPSPSGPNPTSPSPAIPSPDVPLLSPPSGPGEILPNPPYYNIPGSPESFPSPSFPVPNPPYYEPSPPSSTRPSPPEFVPSPYGFAPSPPVFQPPVVFPPPTVSSPPSTGIGSGSHVWCVAKPSVPDPILQEAMNYACGSGADCDPILPNGSCYQPNSPLAHTSYAFNSYWQRTKVGGGTCDFGGTAILITVDPSSQGCKFVSL